jgi:hypothetical protein
MVGDYLIPAPDRLRKGGNDHVLGAVHADRKPKLTGPYKESDPFHEPLVTYAYLAGVTKIPI